MCKHLKITALHSNVFTQPYFWPGYINIFINMQTPTSHLLGAKTLKERGNMLTKQSVSYKLFWKS